MRQGRRVRNARRRRHRRIRPGRNPWWDRVLGLRLGKNADLARARALFLEGRMAEGLEIVEQTARKYPEDAYVWFMLGKARYQTKELELAEQSFRKALALEPKWD